MINPNLVFMILLVGSRLPSLEERGDMILMFRPVEEVDRIMCEDPFVCNREAGGGYERIWQGILGYF